MQKLPRGASSKGPAELCTGDVYFDNEYRFPKEY